MLLATLGTPCFYWLHALGDPGCCPDILPRSCPWRILGSRVPWNLPWAPLAPPPPPPPPRPKGHTICTLRSLKGQSVGFMSSSTTRAILGQVLIFGHLWEWNPLSSEIGVTQDNTQFYSIHNKINKIY